MIEVEQKTEAGTEKDMGTRRERGMETEGERQRVRKRTKEAQRGRLDWIAVL